MDIKLGNERYNVNVNKSKNGYICTIGEKNIETDIEVLDDRRIAINNKIAEFIRYDGKTVIFIDGERYEFREEIEEETSQDVDVQENIIKAPMPGLIIKVNVKKGDKVKKGDLLLILEAMKMQHEIRSKADMEVKNIYVEEGEQVEAFATLVELSEPDNGD